MGAFWGQAVLPTPTKEKCARAPVTLCFSAGAAEAKPPGSSPPSPALELEVCGGASPGLVPLSRQRHLGPRSSSGAHPPARTSGLEGRDPHG